MRIGITGGLLLGAFGDILDRLEACGKEDLPLSEAASMLQAVGNPHAPELLRILEKHPDVANDSLKTFVEQRVRLVA